MKRTTGQTPEQVAESARALGSAVGDFWKSFAGLKVPFDTVSELQNGYLKQATELWNQTLTHGQPERDGKAAAAAVAHQRQALRRTGVDGQPGGRLHGADVPAERTHADAAGRFDRGRPQDARAACASVCSSGSTP